MDGKNFLDALESATLNLISTYNDLKNTTRYSLAVNYRHFTDAEDWSGGISVSQRLLWLAPKNICTGRPDFYGAMSLQYQGGNYPNDRTSSGEQNTQRQHLSGVRSGLAIYYQDRIPFIEHRNTDKSNDKTETCPPDAKITFDNNSIFDNHRWSKQIGVELVLPNGLAQHEAYDAFFRYRDLRSDSETTLTVGKDAYNHVFVNIGFGYSYPIPHDQRQNLDHDDQHNKKHGKTALDETDDWTTFGSPIPPRF